MSHGIRGWERSTAQAALAERAAARRSTFSIRGIDTGNWLAAMEQETPIGVAVVQSSESEDRHAALAALLWADDFVTRSEREGGPRVGGRAVNGRLLRPLAQVQDPAVATTLW